MMPEWRQLQLRRAADADARLLYAGLLFIGLLATGLSIAATVFGGAA